MPLFKYPYTDYSILNLDWVVERIQEMYSIMDQKINEAVTPIRNDLNALTVSVDGLSTNLTSLTNTVNTHTNNIENLYTRTNNMGQTIGTMLGDITSINSDINTINSDINTISGTVNTHTSEIADIYEKIAEIDPDTGLMVDARNFNVEDKTASVLNTAFDFTLTGGNRYTDFPMYPDLIPGTTSGYYTRVTMQADAVTNKIKLPSELTTGTYPIIRRGTFATNVNVDAEIYSGDPIEYTINGSTFTVEGDDDNAIILMCIMCIRRYDNHSLENVYINDGVEVVKPMPYSTAITNHQYIEGAFNVDSHLPYGLRPWIYFFDIDGNLLSYTIASNDSSNPTRAPSGTYSVWYGINTISSHEEWTNPTFKFYYAGLAGSYHINVDNELVTMHRVKFDANDAPGVDNTRYQIIYKNGLYGLGSDEKVDMFTGDVSINGTIIPSRKYNVANDGFNRLVPDINYNVELKEKESGYLDADLYYNKIMAIINGLDANNTSY